MSRKKSLSVEIHLEITQMIKLAYKDNETVMIHCMPPVQEVKKELNMVIGDMEDTKNLRIKIPVIKTTMLAKKNTETTVNKKTKIY